MKSPYQTLGLRTLGAAIAVLLAASCGSGGSGESDDLWRFRAGDLTDVEPNPDAPDVLVIMVDTLRPDHLGFARDDRDTSPFLDRWAEGATIHERAYSHASHTRIAMASLFTGTLPSLHRVVNVDRKPSSDDPEVTTDVLHPALVTWGESLAGVGYETWGFSTNPHICEGFGFTQGFSHWWQTESRDGKDTVDKVLEALTSRARREAREARRPLFLYVHLMDPHNPYRAPGKWKDYFDVPPGKLVGGNAKMEVSPEDLTYTRARYDAEIRYLDHQLERLLTAWEKRETPERRGTILMSDHGDEFQEHGGMGHGTTVFEELVRTVLVVKRPGHAVGRRQDVVCHTDVHRLVLEWAGATPEPYVRGRTSSEWDRSDPALLAASAREWVGLREGSYTLVLPRGAEDEAVLFDRDRDPLEQEPIRDGDVRAALLESYRTLLAEDTLVADELGTPLRVELEEALLQEMKGLGYMGDE